jgi:hypothetical protein
MIARSTEVTKESRRESASHYLTVCGIGSPPEAETSSLDGSFGAAGDKKTSKSQSTFKAMKFDRKASKYLPKEERS